MNAEWITKHTPVTRRWVRGGLRWDSSARRCCVPRSRDQLWAATPISLSQHLERKRGEKKTKKTPPQRWKVVQRSRFSAASANTWTRAVVATATCAPWYQRKKSGRIIAMFQATFYSGRKLIAPVFLCQPATLLAPACLNQLPLQVKLKRLKARFTEVVVVCIRAFQLVESQHPLVLFSLTQCRCDPNLVHSTQICCHKN